MEAGNVETFCLVCGKKSGDHDKPEWEDCGEAWARYKGALNGEGYTEAPRS